MPCSSQATGSGNTHEVAGPVEQFIVFGPSLPRPRFIAAGTPGELIVGETGEQSAPSVAAMTVGAERPLGPGLQGKRPAEVLLTS